MSFVDVIRNEFPLDKKDIPEVVSMINDELEFNRKMIHFDRINNLTGSLWLDKLYEKELLELLKEVIE